MGYTMRGERTHCPVLDEYMSKMADCNYRLAALIEYLEDYMSDGSAVSEQDAEELDVCSKKATCIQKEVAIHRDTCADCLVSKRKFFEN